MEYTINDLAFHAADLPRTAGFVNAAAVDTSVANGVSSMPGVPSWAHASTPEVGSRRIDRTRINAATVGIPNADTGTYVAAVTKQGAPPRGEPR